MSDDFWNAHNQGRQGNARPVGGSPSAWQGYDQGKAERERQQASVNQNTTTQASIANNQPSSKVSSASGDIYGLPILIFMGLFTWIAVEVNSYFEITNGTTVGISAAVVSYIVGIFIRDFLLAALGIALMLTVVAGVGFGGYYYFTKDDSVANVSTKSETNKGTIDVGKLIKEAGTITVHPPGTSLKPLTNEQKAAQRDAAERIAKQERPGCNACQDVIKNEEKITSKHLALFKLAAGEETRFIAVCGSIASYCSKNAISW